MKLNDKIFVAGHRGMVGSAILNKLTDAGYCNIIVRERGQLDLRDQLRVNNFFATEKPNYVFMAAAVVSGIGGNIQHPVKHISDNLEIQANVINAAYRNDVEKFLFLGSSCIYPRDTPQPISESQLLAGPLEPTNEPYAIAKIAGIKLCQAYASEYGWNAISLMPTNLYGIGDNFNPESSHVLAALLRKFHEAKQYNQKSVTVWGTGKPKREFLNVDDLADACVFLMQYYDSPEIINVGTGSDITITELANLIKSIVDCNAEIVYDTSKPDGTQRKLLDVSKLHRLGWSHNISLEHGIAQTYTHYNAHCKW